MGKIFAMAAREGQYILGNRRLLLIMCFIPVLYILLFGLLYSNHVVKHIKTAVLDYNNTASSRMVIQAFRDSEKFDVVTQAASEEELRQLLETRQVITGLVIPEDLDTQVKKGHSSEVLVMVNGTNMLFSNSVMSSASEIVSTLSAGTSIKILELNNSLLPGMAKPTALPLSFRLRVWYNPTFNYSNFLLLGLACTVLQQVVMLYMSIAVVREKEQAALPGLLAAGYRPYQLILGKMIPYFIINLLDMALVLSICFTLFQLPFRGSYWALMTLIIVFLLPVLSLGVLLSVICKNELEATQIAMLIATPSFLFSGFTWPYQAMPAAAKVISAALPLTYLVNDVRDVALMGIDLSQVLPSILVLSGMTLVLLPTAIWCFSRQCRKTTTPTPKPQIPA